MRNEGGGYDHWITGCLALSDVGLSPQEGGALTGATVAGRGGHREGGVRVVTHVSPITVAAVYFVLQHKGSHNQGRSDKLNFPDSR